MRMVTGGGYVDNDDEGFGTLSEVGSDLDSVKYNEDGSV